MRAFVIAMQCEADCVRPWLGPDDRLYVSGIGKVNAAAATQRAICEGADEIWNVGLCGGFGDDIEVGDIYAVDKATEYDFDLSVINHVSIGVIDGFDSPYISLARFPSSLHNRTIEQSEQSEQSNNKNLDYRTLATGDRFNDSEDDHDLIVKQLGASLRDMEGAAIAHVCKLNRVKCLSLKCVSDVAGRGSMTGQYETNKAKCLLKLGEFLRGFLKHV